MQWQWCYCKLKADSLNSFHDMVDEEGLINKGDQFGRTPLVRVLGFKLSPSCNCCSLWSRWFHHRQCSMKQINRMFLIPLDGMLVHHKVTPGSLPAHINFYSPGWFLDIQRECIQYPAILIKLAWTIIILKDVTVWLSWRHFLMRNSGKSWACETVPHVLLTRIDPIWVHFAHSWSQPYCIYLL